MVMGELALGTNVLVTGSGPGGYAAAFRAADLGLEVTMVDMAPRPEGLTCKQGRGLFPRNRFQVHGPLLF